MEQGSYLTDFFRGLTDLGLSTAGHAINDAIDRNGGADERYYLPTGTGRPNKTAYATSGASNFVELLFGPSGTTIRTNRIVTWALVIGAIVLLFWWNKRKG